MHVLEEVLDLLVDEQVVAKSAILLLSVFSNLNVETQDGFMIFDKVLSRLNTIRLQNAKSFVGTPKSRVSLQSFLVGFNCFRALGK